MTELDGAEGSSWSHRPTPPRSRTALLWRSAVGTLLVVGALTHHLLVPGRPEALSVLIAAVALALLLLTTAVWWRVVGGAVAGWCIAAGEAGARGAAALAVAQTWPSDRTQSAAEALVDIVFTALGFIASVAALLAVSGALRIRRR